MRRWLTELRYIRDWLRETSQESYGRLLMPKLHSSRLWKVINAKTSPQ